MTYQLYFLQINLNSQFYFLSCINSKRFETTNFKVVSILKRFETTESCINMSKTIWLFDNRYISNIEIISKKFQNFIKLFF